jgi:hypothetical protein
LIKKSNRCGERSDIVDWLWTMNGERTPLREGGFVGLLELLSLSLLAMN